MQGRYEEHVRDLFVLGKVPSVMELKKQNSIALSTIKTEYIAAGHCCAQLLWMGQTPKDFGFNLSKVPLLCDNESAIRMVENTVEHSRTKYIDIRHHFFERPVTKGRYHYRPCELPSPISRYLHQVFG
jgi:hypothetical protein